LQNVIEHGVVLFEPGMLIQPGDIPFALHSEDTPDVLAPFESFSCQRTQEEDGFHATRERLLARFERRYLTSELATLLEAVAGLAGAADRGILDGTASVEPEAVYAT
jgi:hypothetical protein